MLQVKVSSKFIEHFRVTKNSHTQALRKVIILSIKPRAARLRILFHNDYETEKDASASAWQLLNSFCFEPSPAYKVFFFFNVFF